VALKVPERKEKKRKEKVTVIKLLQFEVMRMYSVRTLSTNRPVVIINTSRKDPASRVFFLFITG
jgi:hypothetical protein